MSRFVDECRKEWNRLGVPEAVANEMAADLTADLAEAEAEGASPEDVLGNGVFDARAFAASWATARGVVPSHPRSRREARAPRWALVAGVIFSCVIGAAGLVSIVQGHAASVAVAIQSLKAFPRPFLGPHAFLIKPNLPGRLVLSHGGPYVLGPILVLVGFLGLCTTLWLWKPWVTLRRRSPIDDDVGLPSYL